MADNGKDQEQIELSRRQFLKMASGVALGVGLGGVLPKLIDLGDGMIAIPASTGYLLVDTRKCAGCLTCMAACSLAHEGKVNISLSRIQVLRNPLAKFPDDITQEQCRQCLHPACVEACPTGALSVDKDSGFVRLSDELKCVGCQQCVEACPQSPSRVIWNYEGKHAQKCDLCINTPYWHKDEPACATLCPMKAIKYTTEIPSQFGDEGYNVNLRTLNWKPTKFL